MTDKTELHLICGFLGAGKTTLMRRLLAAQPKDERLAVVVNEFGRLGIDGKLLEGFENQMRQLTSGCICCELMTDFRLALGEMVADFSPHRILVEATGLAQASDLLEGVRQVSREYSLKLGSVTTVVDVEMFTHREMMGRSYFGQIAAADLVVLNKTDLIEPGEVEPLLAELAKINSTARLAPSVHCALDRELVLHPRGPGAATCGQGPAPVQNLVGLQDLAGKPSHDPEGDEFKAFAFEHEGTLRRADLDKWLAGLAWEVFRVKGRVRTSEGALWLNHTYRRPELTKCHDGGPTQLAFVTWGVEEDAVLPGLRACLIKDA